MKLKSCLSLLLIGSVLVVFASNFQASTRVYGDVKIDGAPISDNDIKNYFGFNCLELHKNSAETTIFVPYQFDVTYSSQKPISIENEDETFLFVLKKRIGSEYKFDKVDTLIICIDYKEKKPLFNFNII